MDYHVTTDDDTVTFLYKLREGISPSSFAAHAALSAGIPREIVQASRRVGILSEAAYTTTTGHDDLTPMDDVLVEGLINLILSISE